MRGHGSTDLGGEPLSLAAGLGEPRLRGGDQEGRVGEALCEGGDHRLPADHPQLELRRLAGSRRRRHQLLPGGGRLHGQRALLRLAGRLRGQPLRREVGSRASGHLQPNPPALALPGPGPGLHRHLRLQSREADGDRHHALGGAPQGAPEEGPGAGDLPPLYLPGDGHRRGPHLGRGGAAAGHRRLAAGLDREPHQQELALRDLRAPARGGGHGQGL